MQMFKNLLCIRCSLPNILSPSHSFTPLHTPQKRTADLQKRVRRDGKVMSLAQTKRTNELEKDMNAWEENRLMTSGVVRLKEVGSLSHAYIVHICMVSSGGQ